MKTKLICIIIISSAAVLFCKVNSKFNGYWGSTIPEGDNNSEIIMYLQNDPDSNLNCEIHTFDQYVKFSSLKAEKVELNFPSISMITNRQANIRYEGRFDKNCRVLSGRLIYNNGSTYEINFTKLSEAQIEMEHPGLLNIGNVSSLYEEPKEYDGSWKCASLTGEDADLNLLEEMVDKISMGDAGQVHSILIVHNGRLVFEKYFDGFGWNDLHPLRSCTKSIASLLTGLLIDHGYLVSEDKKLVDLLTGYEDYDKEEWSEVSVKHILTMSAGLDWNMREHDNIWNERDDVVKAALEQSFKNRPGEKWEYRNPNVDLLGPVIINLSGKSVQSFAEEYLFSKLDINTYKWDNFKNTDYPLLDGSLALAPRDMAKIGQMVLDNGIWNDRRVISEEWLKKSTKPYYKVDSIFEYSYLWWLGKSSIGKNINCVLAHGIGGQHIVIFPSLNLVVVTTGGNYEDIMSTVLLSLIDNYIVKSFSK
jgi:CubicO group peptidase (beta-lactamase class C family)